MKNIFSRLIRRSRPGHISGWWVAAILTIAAAILGVYVWVAITDEAGLAAGATTQTHSERRDLALVGWAEHARLAPSGTARVYLIVENRSKVAVQDLRILGFESPGLEKVGTCWKNELPSCGTHARAGGPLPATLAPGEAVTIWADLGPKGIPGAHAATALVTFTLAGERQSGEVLGLSIGPIEVAAGRTLLQAKAFLSFLKDLALPLVLALLAYAFQHLQQDRSRVQETFNAILPQAHQNAAQHLLPVVGATTRLLARCGPAIDPLNTEQMTALRQSLFYTLGLVKGMRDLASQGGGIFFTTLLGEDAVMQCWRRIFARAEESLDASDLSTVLDRWSKDESLSSMGSNFDPPRTFWPHDAQAHEAAFQRLQGRFGIWLLSAPFSAFDRPLLGAFRDIMQREIDRLYSTWYGEDPQLNSNAIATLLVALDTAPINDEQRTTLRRSLCDYLKSSGVKDPSC